MRLTSLKNESAAGAEPQQTTGKTLAAMRGALGLLAGRANGADGSPMVFDLGLRDEAGQELVLIVAPRERVSEVMSTLSPSPDARHLQRYPTSLERISSQLHVIEQRMGGRADPPVAAGDLIIDPKARTVITRRGELIRLSGNELTLLLALARQPGALLTRDQLADAMYTEDDQIRSNTIHVYIHHLRRKLGDQIIQTVRGAGWRLACSASPTAAAA